MWRAVHAAVFGSLKQHRPVAKIGYLARDMAETFQKRLLRQSEPVRCPAQLRGGADGQKIGVVLDFDDVHV